MSDNWQPGKTGGQLVQLVEQAKLIQRSYGPRFESGIAHDDNFKSNMKELDRIIVIVTRINYGFDGTELQQEGMNEHSIKGERTIVEMDGEVYYDRYIANHLMMKRPLSGSPIDCFWDYIVQLFPTNKPQCRGNAGCNGCDNIHFFGKRRLEVLYFKKKPLNVRLKKFFLGFKSPFGKKFGGFKE